MTVLANCPYCRASRIEADRIIERADCLTADSATRPIGVKTASARTVGVESTIKKSG